MATNYAYDNLSRLQSVLHQLAGSTIDGATYTMDNAGNRTAKTDQRTAVTSNYAYDAIYELTGVTQGTNTKESYTYDTVGNRLSSLGVSPYTYNTSNQLTATPTGTYTYDNNGNRLTATSSFGTVNYTWDFENRLIAEKPAGSSTTNTLKYDPFGRRIQEVNPFTSTTSIYAYDGDNLIEEVNASGAVVARYAQGLNIDEPLAMLRSGATSYYHADGLGSITSLTNTAGTVASTQVYDSFGNTTSSTGTLTNPFRYTAREATDFHVYFYRARYYDPAIGRFISEDPLRLTGDTNLYAYVDNDPVNALDPMGLCKIYVKFDKVIKGLPGYHAYIVTVDPSGQMMGFRGGPGQDGNIATLYAPYDKYFPDYNPGKTPCKKVLDNNEPCRQYNVRLESILDAIESDKIPYSSYPFLPGSKNSNSVISEALFVLGLPVPTPPVWAPGWGTPLFPFGNGGATSGPAGPGGGGGGGPLP